MSGGPKGDPSTLSHVDGSGAAHMVDVGGKPVTRREAVATGTISMNDAAFDAIRANQVKKGDVIAAARIAGVMAAKKTSELIPLCHPLPISKVSIAFDLVGNAITVTATVATDAQTGVEMEAMTAASVALLTIYDMAKALDKAMVIGAVQLRSKTGGKSGNWSAPSQG